VNLLSIFWNSDILSGEVQNPFRLLTIPAKAKGTQPSRIKKARGPETSSLPGRCRCVKASTGIRDQGSGTGCRKTRWNGNFMWALCQGMTLVVPKTQQINVGFTGCGKTHLGINSRRFVTGHDFSRADKANRTGWALAPEVRFSHFSPVNKPFSAACSAPEACRSGSSPANSPFSAACKARGDHEFCHL
jgi:hypothetical protein